MGWACGALSRYGSVRTSSFMCAHPTISWNTRFRLRRCTRFTGFWSPLVNSACCCHGQDAHRNSQDPFKPPFLLSKAPGAEARRQQRGKGISRQGDCDSPCRARRRAHGRRLHVSGACVRARRLCRRSPLVAASPARPACRCVACGGATPGRMCAQTCGCADCNLQAVCEREGGRGWRRRVPPWSPPSLPLGTKAQARDCPALVSQMTLCPPQTAIPHGWPPAPHHATSIRHWVSAGVV